MTYAVTVDVKTRYLAEQSKVEGKNYAFSYHITIHNTGDSTIQLLNRHWIISDGNQKVREVHGEGVIGQQPIIKPGDQFSYTSGVVLDTPVGTMEGSYQMMKKGDNTLFDADIPPFLLHVPGSVN
jgi:ApaG protein